jgi:ABC-type branched-subunit amino acid transport system ATPase component
MLAMEAELLLLDEPASGLDPQSVEKLFGMIRELVQRGKTVCIIEHNLDVIKDLTHRVVYLDEGRAFAEGTPAAVMNDPELAERYFGA